MEALRRRVSRFRFTPLEVTAATGLLSYALAIFFTDSPSLKASMGTVGLFLLYFVPPLAFITMQQRKWEHRISVVALWRIMPSLLALCYCIYAFKHLPHVTDRFYHDDWMLMIDRWVAPMTEMERAFWGLFGASPHFETYIFMFMMLFWVSLPLAAKRGAQHFKILVLAIGLNLLFGGWLYNLFPAMGPYLQWPREEWRPLLAYMHDNTVRYRESMGQDYSPEEFVYIICAWPSLHVSLALVMAWQCWRTSRLMGVIAGFVLAYFLSHSRLVGFHYFIDVPAGIALGIGSHLLAIRLLHLNSASAAQTR
jgi:hypothetical protein